jgi:hypothetical protein
MQSATWFQVPLPISSARDNRETSAVGQDPELRAGNQSGEGV